MPALAPDRWTATLVLRRFGSHASPLLEIDDIDSRQGDATLFILPSRP
jgi:hypothetical protein